jgi:hypothetical protein
LAIEVVKLLAKSLMTLNLSAVVSNAEREPEKKHGFNLVVMGHGRMGSWFRNWIDTKSMAMKFIVQTWHLRNCWISITYMEMKFLFRN